MSKYTKPKYSEAERDGTQDEMRLVELFHQINRRIWRLIAPMFKDGRLSVTESVALMAVHKRGMIHTTRLAKLIGIPASTLTGILDRLVRQGLLKRGRDPEDRRSVVMTETPKAREFIRNWMAPMHSEMRGALKSMPGSRKKRLIQDLQYVLDSLESTDESHECP